MNKKLQFFFLILMLNVFLHSLVFGQGAQVSVNNFTGTVQVIYPLYNLKNGQVNMPINLVYSGTGIKVKDVEGNAGMGWNVQIGGQISRQLRGLPDDMQKDEAQNTKLGWLYNSNTAKINAFGIANDNSQSTCNDETADYNYISSNFGDLSDTEPDLFYVNAPGLSCQLMFDQDHQIKTIPYQDLKINYEVETAYSDSRYGRIKSFTITKPDGMKYVFGAAEMSRKQTITSASPSSINFFKHDYDLFSSSVAYASAWKLTEMRDVGGNGLILSYITNSNTSSNSRIALSTSTSSTTVYPYTIIQYSTPQVLDRIDYANYDDLGYPTGVQINYTTALTSNVPMLSSITGMGRGVGFSYSAKQCSNNANAYKTFLTGVNTDSGHDEFNYNGIVNGTYVANSVISLPDSTSKEIDLWGYYNSSGASSLLPAVYINPSNTGYEKFRNISPNGNGAYSYSISGAARLPNSATVANGSLASISYSTGGTTSFTYEPNDYYDATAGVVQLGGGIRIKQITNYDGINSTNNIITNYTYTNPANGLSSGKPISLPVLAFTSNYTGSGTAESQWKNSVVRLEENINQEDNAIFYSHVTLSKSGAGSTRFEYALPATFFDASYSSDWVPTVNYAARLSCVTGGFVVNDKYTYPFAPNPNYDFERGLLSAVSQYDESGQKVEETTYTYQRTGASQWVTGLRFEDQSGIRNYAKYIQYLSVGKLLSSESRKVYTLPYSGQYSENAINYLYEGNQHKMPTAKLMVNSDGSVIKSYTKYISDYALQPSSDQQVQALYSLQQLGLNLPIENYTQVERNGTTKTVLASLIKYKTWTFPYLQDRILPVQQLSLQNGTGLTDFQVSSVAGNTFTHDSRHQVTGNVIAYDKAGYAISSDDNKNNKAATFISQLMSSPVAAFSGALASEVAYSNFDTDGLESAFSLTGSVNSATVAHSGNIALQIASDTEFSKVITMNGTRKKYTFSVWVRSNTTGSFALTLTNSSGGNSVYSLAFDNSAGSWKYYQLKVPVENMSPTFTVKLQSSAATDIDDILFYPTESSSTIYGYDPISFVKTMETNNNGRSTYYEYDDALRLKHIVDHDKNILLKRTFVKMSDSLYKSVSIYSYSTVPVVNESATFTDSYSSHYPEGVTYTWNFGDGTLPVTATGVAPLVQHIFSAVGTYTISVTKTSPIYGSSTDSRSITVGNPTTPVRLYATGWDVSVDVYDATTSVLKTSYNASSFNAGGYVNIDPGNYKFRIVKSGPYNANNNPTGYKRVGYLSTPLSSNYYALGMCQPSQSASAYYFTINITGQQSISFYMDDNECDLEEVQ